MTENDVTDKDTEVIDRLDCLNKNIAKLRPDIREIIREVVGETFSELRKELRKPQPYLEEGYRS